MVIKRKRVTGASALVEVEADAADTVDTNGTTTVISAVSAKSAKFSGGLDMTPNSGKRIGTLKTIIDPAFSDRRSRSVIQQNVSNSGNAIDDDVNNQTGNTPDSATQVAITIDFSSSATTAISAKIQVSGSKTITLETSPDNSAWTVRATTTSTGTVTMSGGTQTYRYARVNVTVNTDGSITIYEVYEGSYSDTATVKIRASNTKDTADGTVLDTQVVTIGTTKTLDTDLFIVESGQYYTLEIASFSGDSIPVKLNNITSIKEVT